MKTLILFILVAANSAVNAQQAAPKLQGDSLYTTSGFVIGKGQRIKLGLGTMPDGDFKFVRINSASLFHNTEISNYASGYNANSANSMNRRNTGREFTVAKLEKRGDEKHGYSYYVVFIRKLMVFEERKKYAAKTTSYSQAYILRARKDGFYIFLGGFVATASSSSLLVI